MGKGKWWGSISHAPFLLTMAPQLWPCWGFLTRKLTGVGGTRKGPWDPKPLSGGDFDISSTPPLAFLFQASTIRIKESFVLKMPMGGGWEASVNQRVLQLLKGDLLSWATDWNLRAGRVPGEAALRLRPEGPGG